MMVFPIIWTKIYEVELLVHQIKKAPAIAGAFFLLLENAFFKVLRQHLKSIDLV